MQPFSKSPAILEAEKGRKFQMFDGNITGEYIEFVSNLTVKASRELTLVSINIALLINDVFTLNFFVSLQKTENFINLDTEQIKNVTYTNDKGVPWFHSNCANAYDFRRNKYNSSQLLV